MYNPYHEEFVKLHQGMGCTFFGLPDSDDFTRLYLARKRLVVQYSWAVPNRDALEVIADLGPIVEVGAGRGYWASLLDNMGVDVIAYDKNPPNFYPNRYCCDGAHFVSVYHQVHEAKADVAAKRHPTRTLLLIWPSHDASWAFDALHAYILAGGRRIAFVGEGEGGCTADDAFHQLLRHCGDRVCDVNIPRWSGMNDFLGVWELHPTPDFIATESALTAVNTNGRMASTPFSPNPSSREVTI